MEQEPGEVTQLLIQLRNGDRNAEAALIPLVYNELRKLASFYLRGESSGNSLQPTASVHEAYIRLAKLKHLNLNDRHHFFALAARLMRRILVDHARTHHAEKRTVPGETVSIEDAPTAMQIRSADLLALDEALNRLALHDFRQARIVELRFFAGMSEIETGAMLGVSARTVKRDWRIAKAWLYREINK